MNLKPSPLLLRAVFRPMDAYARLWLYDIHHRQTINNSDISFFPYLDSDHALDLLWMMDFLGHKKWDDSPLFFIDDAQLVQRLGLPSHRSYSFNQIMELIERNRDANLRVIKPLIAYQFAKKIQETPLRNRSKPIELFPGLLVGFSGDDIEIKESPNHFPWQFLHPHLQIEANGKNQLSRLVRDHRQLSDSLMNLFDALSTYQQLSGMEMTSEKNLESSLSVLRDHSSPEEIAQILETHFPLQQRLSQASGLLALLPSRYDSQKWLPIKALKVKIYDPASNTLVPVNNFTAYSKTRFQRIRDLYEKLDHRVQVFVQNPIDENRKRSAFLAS